MTRIDADEFDVAERQRPRRSVASIVGGTLLNIAAVGGMICIVLVILAYCFNITLIMFKTGSMSPTIPTGSLALVREIPASDISIGDVVTVDRVGQLPVTHRVTSVNGDRGTERTITLKGDANLSEDPAPYVVSTVRVVLASVPGLAYVVIWFSNPWVLAGLTLGCSSLVMWAFWPRSGRKRPPGSSGGNGASESESVADGTGRSQSRQTGRRPARHAAVRNTAVAVLLGAGLTVSSVAAPASAEPQENVVAGEAVVLTAIGDASAMRSLTPGASAPWEVGITTKPQAGPGSIDVTLAGAGSAALGLVMVVDSCTVRWTGSGCAGTSTRVLDETRVPVDGVARALLSMPSEEVRWVRFDVSMPASADVVDASVALTVTANGIGDDVSVSPGPISSLPSTGTNLGFALWAAAGAIMLGLLGAWIGRLHRRTRTERTGR